MSDQRGLADLREDDLDHISLCEALDRVLNRGAVVVGEITISVADIDLVYLGVQLILTSIETAHAAALGSAGARHAVGTGASL